MAATAPTSSITSSTLTSRTPASSTVRVVLGPYMPAKKRRKLISKSAGIPHLELIEFDNRMEELIAGARGVVAMGGYNTYCEILSFDKPALIVPRVAPRQEQLIRARRAGRTRHGRDVPARGGGGR